MEYLLYSSARLHGSDFNRLQKHFQCWAEEIAKKSGQDRIYYRLQRDNPLSSEDELRIKDRFGLLFAS